MHEADCSTLSIAEVNPSKPSGYYIDHQVYIQKLHILPTKCIYMFYAVVRIHSVYSSMQQ